MLGVYLKEPHARLIADGKKTAIAHAIANLDIVGERVLCTKEDGQGLALGVLTVGESISVPVDEFDDRVSDHHVSKKERLQWWPMREKLYLYPIEGFEPFENEKDVDADGAPIDMGDVVFESSKSGREDEMPWKVFKEGDEWCVYKLDADGNKTGKSRGCHPSKPKADAQARALYAAEGRGEMKSTDADSPTGESEKMYGVPYGITSFADLDAAEEALEQAELAQKRAYQLQRMVYYIFEDEDIKDKAAALEALAKEYAQISMKSESKALSDGEAVADKGTASDNNLPDSAFLYVEPGDKDDEGKTVPRSKRHLPYKKADGSVDLPRLRNALSRLGQPKTGTSGGSKWLSESLRKRLVSKAQGMLKRETGGGKSLAQALTEAVTATVVDVWHKMFGNDDDIDLDALHDRLVAAGSKDTAFAIKGKDGKVYWMQWTTNAFRDRDGEIFTTKSIDDFVDRREREFSTKGRKLGEFWFWHLNGTKFADVTCQARVGRFLVQVGPFDDTEFGNAFKEFFLEHPDGHDEFAPTGWGASHGYKFNPEDKEDAVYDWFDIEESTVLPEDMAANQYNPAPGVLTEEAKMNERQRKALAEILGDKGVAQVEAEGERKTKALEEANIAFKEAEAEAAAPAATDAPAATETEVPAVDETVEEAQPEVEPEVEAEVEAEAEVEVEAEVEPEAEAETEAETEAEDDALAEGKNYAEVTDAIVTVAEAVKGLREQVQALTDEVQTLKRSDAEKVEERIAGIPGASLKSLIEEMVEGKSAIGKPETHVDGRDTLVRGKAKLPAELAKRQEEDIVSPVPGDWLR